MRVAVIHDWFEVYAGAERAFSSFIFSKVDTLSRPFSFAKEIACGQCPVASSWFAFAKVLSRTKTKATRKVKRVKAYPSGSGTAHIW